MGREQIPAMPRMLSRNKFPPHGWQVLIPEAGMKKPFEGSFTEASRFLHAFVTRNPALAHRLHLPMTIQGCEDWVDTYTAQRCLKHGWVNMVNLTSVPGGHALAEAQKKTAWESVAAGTSRVGAAAAAYAEMFGGTGPVPKPLAEQRAAVCENCPKNDKATGLLAHFTQTAAQEVMGILGALKDLDLRTSNANRLGTCKVCHCPMAAKVFAPLAVILKHMPAEDQADLQPENPRCWILTEKEALQ